MQKLLKKYTMGFEGWALLLFAAVMLPNILWSFLPAPNDVLRAESITPVTDGIASFCQMLMVFCLVCIRRTDRRPVQANGAVLGCIGCVLLYWLAWGCYYAGIVHPAVLLCMTLAPCAAFLLFALERRNGIALAPAAVFTLCHLYFCLRNFLMPG
jgi:hypothetical protein